MEKGTTFVGLDVHKDAINVAMLLPGETRPVEWQTSNDPAAVRRLVRKLQRSAVGEVRVCYEAGPCGYAVQRTVRELGVWCIVVALSLIPRKPGERVKTDRRDARKLAELLRAGLLTQVHPPTEADEAVRDLCRAREDAHGGSGPRTPPGEQATVAARLDLEWKQEGVGPGPSALAAQPALRAQGGQTAMCLVAELHDFMRFQSARGLMAYLGLVPSEHSSGGKERRGEITKAGNRHARRLLIEASWHYRHHPSTLSLRKRREGQPARIVAIADRAMLRLHRRFNRMLERSKPRSKVVVAVARELTGFIWAAMRNHAA